MITEYRLEKYEKGNGHDLNRGSALNVLGGTEESNENPQP
jgi:hypothetical protein